MSAGYAWFFAVTLGRPEVPGWRLGPAAAWNVLLFGAFAAHHSVMARAHAKAWLVQQVPVALERSLYVWIASLLLAAVCALWAHVPGLAYALPRPLAWIGTVAQLAGVWLTIRGAAGRRSP